MRFVFVGILLLFIDFFAFQAVSSVLISNSTLYAVITVLFWSVPVLAVGYVFASERGWTQTLSRKVKITITSLIFILYFSKLLMALIIILDNLRRGVSWLVNAIFPGADLNADASMTMASIGLFAGLIPMATLIYGLIRNPYRYRVIKKDIVLSDIPEQLDGLRIVQISDIHTGSLLATSRVEKSVQLINGLDPDIVCFTGDLVNNTADEAEPFIEMFRGIKARYGIYSITGNHDYGDYVQWPSHEAKRANFEKLKTQHRRMGWDLLINTHRSLNINGASVSIIGVENYSSHARFQKYGDMTAAVNGLPESDLNILLSHDPSHWDDEIISKYRWVDLMLAGHTHGFQFGVEIGEAFRWSPVQYVYPRWAGLYKVENQYLYINRGLGFLGYPGRVGILPEITLLTIRKQP